MIVWVASFPRSGNTFLRIVLHRRYGIRTSTVYDVDGVAQRLGPDTIGYEDRPGTLDAMRESPSVHFVNTHRQRDGDIAEDDPALCLVRDGRDALVSWARQASESDPSRYEQELRTRLLRGGERGTGGWGENVLSWLTPPTPNRIIVRYEDLVAEPTRVVDKTLAGLRLPSAMAWTPRLDRALPSFAELHAVDRDFFRRGRSGTHRDELPPHLHDLFWSRPNNVEAMRLLGWGARGSGG